jgi:N-acetylglutamate synthase-like GNAT family acetyltransferase
VSSPEQRPQHSEKEFYLQSFRNRSILLHLDGAYSTDDVGTVIDELTANATMVIIVSAHVAHGLPTCALTARDLLETGRRLIAASSTLLAEGAAYVRAPADADALSFSCRLASRLGARKLVVVDPRGGLLTAGGEPRSFVNAAVLARLCGARRARSPWRLRELRALLETVRRGVESVNFTTAEGLEAELFTYEGSGTLLTASDYCTVERLRVDDFAQAMWLLDRGEREGFLLERDSGQRARLLLSGYGAWFEGRRLAGIAGLETEVYKRQRLGEIIGLYTITRFQGEGVGVRILETIADVAVAQRCRALFACTSNAKARLFFERHGFRPVATSELPRRKWRSRRGPLPAALWLDL